MSKHITIEQHDDGQRLDRWLQQRYPHITYPFIQKAMRTGDIRLDGKKVEGKERLEMGQQLRLPPAFHHAPEPGSDRPLTADEIKLAKSMVVWQDDYMLAINKPSGLATQGGSKTFKHVDRLLGAFTDVYGNRPKLVHRLDKDTSGIMIAAKTRDVAARLGHMFKHRDIEKTYLALTLGVPRAYEGKINRPLFKTATPDGEKVIVDKENGKPAVSYYQVLSHHGKDMGLVALRPETGRMHQLRVHLSHIYAPILGDRKYGGMMLEGKLAEAAQERLWLHALCLHMPHPVTNKPLFLSAPVPAAMRRWLERWNMMVPDVTDTETPVDPMDKDA